MEVFQNKQFQLGLPLLVPFCVVVVVFFVLPQVFRYGTEGFHSSCHSAPGAL